MRGPGDMRGPPDIRGPGDMRGPPDMRGPQDMRGPGRGFICTIMSTTSVAKAMKVLRKLGCCLQIEVILFGQVPEIVE